MAGVKITDLTTLATAASDDLLYIVDVSDTSQSPQGTSKQIELGNLAANASAAFAPTLSGLTDAIISTGGPDGMYSKNGNVVTLTFIFNIELDFTIALTGTLNFTLPFAIGSGYGYGVGVVDTEENINVTISGNTLKVNTDNSSLVLGLTPVYCTMQYFIA
jgi:hypothetical protein